MTNYKLLLTCYNTLLLSDEHISDGDYCVDKNHTIYKSFTHEKRDGDCKIIAGDSHFPIGATDMPKINQASIDKCLAEKEERRVLELAKNYSQTQVVRGKNLPEWDDEVEKIIQRNCIAGYNLHKSENEEKKWSDEEMANCFSAGWNNGCHVSSIVGEKKYSPFPDKEEYMKSLQKPVIYDCEIEMDLEISKRKYFKTKEECPNCYGLDADGYYTYPIKLNAQDEITITKIL